MAPSTFASVVREDAPHASRFTLPPRAIPLDSPSSPACGVQCRNFTLQRTRGPGRRALNLAGPGRAGSRELTFCAPSQIRRRLVYVSFFLPETSFSHRFPHTEPGLQPYFARGAYQRRNSTSGCLVAPLRGLCRHRESASRFPSTHLCGPLRSIHQRETLGVHSFRPGGAAGDRRRTRTC